MTDSTDGLRCEYCGTVTNGEPHRVTVCWDVLRATVNKYEQERAK